MDKEHNNGSNEKMSGCAGIFWFFVVMFIIFCFIIISSDSDKTTNLSRKQEAMSTQNEQNKLKENEYNKYVIDRNAPKHQIVVDNNMIERAKDAAYVKGFEQINTTELEEFCSDSGYIPYQYINDFKQQFSKTILNAQNIFNEISKDVNADIYKYILENSKKTDVLGNELDILHKQYNISKQDYCKIFDNERQNIINAKIKIIKTDRPNMYLD